MFLATIFCACHDSTTIVPCANNCSDQFITIRIWQNEISIFELLWKNCWWNGPLCNCMLIKMSLEIVPKDSIDKDPAMVWIMGWCRIGDKPLSEPILTRFTDANMRHRGEMNWMSQCQWTNHEEFGKMINTYAPRTMIFTQTKTKHNLTSLYRRCIVQCCKDIFIIHVSLVQGLTHWVRDEMDNTSQTTFSNVFSSNEYVWI